MSDSDFLSAIKTLDDSEARELQARLRHMMDHIAKRIEYAEARRNFFLTSSAASFAAGVAIIGFALTKPVWMPLEVFLWALGVGLAAFAVIVWLVHASHVNFPYPFTSVANVNKWFYRYAIPTYKDYHFPWIRKLSATDAAADASKFSRDYSTFLENSKTNLIDAHESAAQDVKQLYLLHVNEMYKNQFLTSLRRTFTRGIVSVLAVAGSAFAIGTAVEAASWPASDSREQFGLQVQSTWAPLYRGSVSAGNLTLKIANRSASGVSIEHIHLADENGLLIPFELVRATPGFPFAVGPGSETTIALLVDLKENRLSSIRSVLLRR